MKRQNEWHPVGLPMKAAIGGLFIGLALHTFGASGPSEAASIGLRSWTPQTSIAVRYVSPGNANYFFSHGNKAIIPSPDGRRFALRTHHGDLVDDANVYQLLVFCVSDVLRALEKPLSTGPAPWRTVTMRHPLEAIREVRWEGNDAILFLGHTTVDAPAQVYRLNLVRGDLSALTDVPKRSGERGDGLNQFALQSNGLIVFAQEREPRAVQKRAYEFVSGARVKDLMTNPYLSHRSVWRSYVSYAGRPLWKSRGVYLPRFPRFTRNGDKAIVVCYPDPVPRSWAAYDGNKTMTPELDNPYGGSAGPRSFGQFLLINLEDETETPLIDAPLGEATLAGSGAGVPTDALWSDNQRNLVLVNTTLPMGSRPDADKMAYIVSYDLETKDWEVLEPIRDSSGVTVKDVTWVVDGKEFLVRHTKNGQPSAGTIYAFDGKKWLPSTVNAEWTTPVVSSEAAPSLVGDLVVELRQSANDAPMVYAKNGGKEVALLPPDPATKSVALARSFRFAWKDGTGGEHHSVLVLPQKPPAGNDRWPLVIQLTITSESTDRLGEFRPDGMAATAYATQALAAKGIAVLELNSPLGHRGNGLQEMKEVQDRVDSSVMALAKQFPIDIDRVGLVGFSRMGYETRYLITHPGEIRPAAAIVNDSYTGSYLLTMALFAEENYWDAVGFDDIYGGSFFKAKGSWLDREVSFNVDKVRTPVLFVDHRVSGFGLVVDTIGAFKAAQKPFEYLLLTRDGGHQLRVPSAREASMQASVDWMCFWLKGEAPKDSERAARWAILRKQQDEVLKTPLPPKGKWVFQGADLRGQASNP